MRRPVIITPELYVALRDWLCGLGPEYSEHLYAWAENLGPPQNADQFAGEVVWVILCAGVKAQNARKTEARVLDALERGRPVAKVFGHRGKAAAIERVWRQREELFAQFRQLLAADDQARLIDWCQDIPFVGPITRYQLAKNLGVDVVKPDRHISRLAGYPDWQEWARPGRIATLFEACMALCRPLAEAFGDRIITVDTVLWAGCNLRVLAVEEGRAVFQLRPADELAPAATVPAEVSSC